jgi:hypothetical protein
MMINIKYGTFLFFGCSLVVGIFVVFFLMPETKGLALEEMDILFNIEGLAYNKRRKADEIIAAQRNAEGVVGGDKDKDTPDYVEVIPQDAKL